MEFKPLKSIVQHGHKLTLPKGKYEYAILNNGCVVIIIPADGEAKKYFEEIE